PSPAESLRRALEQQHVLIQNHDAALQELSKCQAETNRTLQEIAGFLQRSSSQASLPPWIRIHLPGQRIQSTPQFLIYSPQSFSQDGRKISFIPSHLSGKALDWAEAKYSSTVDYGCTFDEFIKEFKQAFNQDTDKTADSRGLLEIKQGNRTVADFAIEFRIKAAASGWGQTALKSAYFHSLNESIKDELATLDEPNTLEDLIRLTIRLDNRLRARSNAKSKSRIFPV
uniref:Ty3 transposon capsid-like protein domain-containing protein n=1 Tax=Poecilia formosa TaxID=48698 RepID=A0A096LQI3_POEFO